MFKFPVGRIAPSRIGNFQVAEKRIIVKKLVGKEFNSDKC